VEYAAQVGTLPVRQTAADAALYDWLRRQPPGPVVELPTNEPDRWMLASTVDGHPRLNGWSGFVPPVSREVNLGLVYSGITPEERSSWMGHVARLGARYLVVHWPDVSARTRNMLRDHVRAGSIRLIERFPEAAVYGVWPFLASEVRFSAGSTAAERAAADRQRAVQ
jgi:hypothetical protein